jgi:hypothetical protein
MAIHSGVNEKGGESPQDADKLVYEGTVTRP